MDVDRWLEGLPPGPITVRQLGEWEAFYDLEPWGSAQDDLRAGTIAAEVHNSRGMVHPARTVRRPSDYFPRIRPKWVIPTLARLKDKLVGIFGRG